MNKWINYSKTFLILGLVFCIGLGICIALCNKIDMHLWLNGTHTAAGDFFFRYYTLVGEWVPYVIVAFLLFYKAGWASFLLADVALSGLIGQGLKYLFDTDRPLTYFANHAPDIQLQLVEGVHMSRFYSFPSGHTITFFAFFLTLTIVLCKILPCNKLFCKIKPLSNTGLSRRLTDGRPTVDRQSQHTLSIGYITLINIFCFLLAVLGAYSRIYLNQHFAEDIFGGAIIGILTTVALLLAVPKLEHTAFWNWNIHSAKSRCNTI